jgi:nucleotide-binding universal stress UspA family protein
MPTAHDAQMYKHILVPTDGSALAEKGARAGIRLAKSLGARVTAVYVMAPYVPPVYGEAALFYTGATPGEYKKMAEGQAAKALARIKRDADTAGIAFSTMKITGETPWQGILGAARKSKCDVIAMASHGRGAIGGVLLGSETNRVLAHSKIPVLVTR